MTITSKLAPILGGMLILAALASCSSSNRACKWCIDDDDCNAGYTCEEFTDNSFRCAKPGIDCSGVFPLAATDDSDFLIADLNGDQLPDLLDTRLGLCWQGLPSGNFDTVATTFLGPI